MEKSVLTISGVRGFIDENGTAQLNLEDCAKGLGFTQIAKSGNESIRWERVNSYLNSFNFIPTSGDGSFIPENIFYRLAMKAKNEVAEKFQAKVADEILPTIRKTGSYTAPQATAKMVFTPDNIIQIAKNWKAEQEKRIAAEQQIETDRPLVHFAHSVAVTQNSMLVRELAKIITQNGYPMGEKRLYNWLRDNGYLMKKCLRHFNSPAPQS